MEWGAGVSSNVSVLMRNAETCKRGRPREGGGRCSRSLAANHRMPRTAGKAPDAGGSLPSRVQKEHGQTNNFICDCQPPNSNSDFLLFLTHQSVWHFVVQWPQETKHPDQPTSPLT